MTTTEKNAPVYRDILNDLLKVKTGLFSIILRLNASVVCDYVLTQIAKYDLSKKRVVFNDEDHCAKLNKPSMTHDQFLSIVDFLTKENPFGQITVNIIIKNGLPLMGTLNISLNKRIKYKAQRTLDKEG